LIGSGARLVTVVCTSGRITSSLEGQQRHDLLRGTAVAADLGAQVGNLGS